MKTFILIHGSWHGSWNWHRIIPILEKAGHRAIALDLPGMGRDKTPIQDDGKIVVAAVSKASGTADFRLQCFPNPVGSSTRLSWVLQM